MDHLKNIVITIIQSNHEKKEEYFQALYKDEFSKYPRLMKLACNATDESKFMEQFNYFMRMKERIHEKTISQNDADVDIGERLANVYLKNVNIK